VYKEKAFDKFKNLIDEIEYKVTKAIFSAKQDIEIKQLEIQAQNLVENLEDDGVVVTQKQNPLFAAPQSQKNPPKQKIRV
jgi:preprotein translocase subunit SecA